MTADGFRIPLLRFKAEVTAPLMLPPATGAALRGALFGRPALASALTRRRCARRPTSWRREAGIVGFA